MPHINEAIDFTVGACIVFQDKVLLIFHKKLQRWLPIGGHIEPDEDPEEALYREIKEESGLDKKSLKIISHKPPLKSNGTKFLYTPNFLDIHQISPTHRHIGMIYFLVSKKGKVTLAENEHSQIKWFEEGELDDHKYDIANSIKFYCREALRASQQER